MTSAFAIVGHAPLRSYTLRGLKPGVTYTVGVAAAVNVGGEVVYGDIAQARLEPPEGLDLAAANPVAISGSTATLTLAEAVRAHQIVTAGYTPPGNNPLRDSDNARNPVPDFTAQSVTNNTIGHDAAGYRERADHREHADHHLQRAPGRELGARGQSVQCRLRRDPVKAATGVQVDRNVVTVTFGVATSHGADGFAAAIRHRQRRRQAAAGPVGQQRGDLH